MAAPTRTATFTTRTFKKTGGNQYEAAGDLSLHGITRPVTLPFTLTMEAGRAIMDSKLSLKRLDFKIGELKPSAGVAKVTQGKLTMILSAQPCTDDSGQTADYL